MAGKTENSGKVIPEKVTLETDQGILESEEKKWGMPLKEVYKHGLAFYKDKEGKAMHLSYEDRLKLVAYTQQAAHGPLDVTSAPPLGVLDVIGRDRRAAWQALGHMTHAQAMQGFLHTLDRLCPLFKPYLEAIQKDWEFKRQQDAFNLHMKMLDLLTGPSSGPDLLYRFNKQEDERAHQELQNRVIVEQEKQNSNKLTEEQQVQKIKDALNAQTYDQFIQYAQQQFPGNFDQQAVLIRQLQDQHYQQYVQQLAADQRLSNSNCTGYEESKERTETVDCNRNDTNVPATELINKEMQTSVRSDCTEESRGEESDGDAGEGDHDEEGDEDDGFPPIEKPRMWTQGDIIHFKQSAESSTCKLIVGHGETVTVRVPTHARARCLCWEFATDNYDIGFGVFFEWGKSPTTEVTVHVSESDDEDDDNDDAYEEVSGPDSKLDPESGAEQRALARERPPVSIVVPIYRRDCHSEVYAGSHSYPGEGVYLLKFDNTYSLWRSKTIYYKIYYTQ